MKISKLFKNNKPITAYALHLHMSYIYPIQTNDKSFNVCNTIKVYT